MKALILVDLQNDFVAGGALAVREGDRVVPVANAVARKFELVVATQDWHPGSHLSFAGNHPGKRVGDVIEVQGLEQVLWPVHCVQGTFGAALVSGLDRGRIARVVQKGTDPAIDSYSGFFDNGHRKATELDAYLKSRGVDAVYLMGLATDYCVKFTALDARKLGYETFLVLDGCRGVDVKAGDSERAVEEMKVFGVKVVTSAEIEAAKRETT
jgi:nicotinamidase/pyrazinamidase